MLNEKEIIATGKDVIEAIENGKKALGIGPTDEYEHEILHAGSRGILGIIGVKPAKVRIWIKAAEATKEKNQNRSEKRHGEGKRRNNKKGERKNENKKPREDKPAESKAEKPRTEVIPESKIKLERREAAPGEDLSYDFVKKLIENVGLNAEAELYSCDDGTRRINIVGDDASVLIGHHGDTLDALQYLANLVSTRKNINGERDKSRVTIDIGGYRAKREETLRALARRMVAKALRNKRSVMLEPMSAYERRIIHSEVQGIEGVSTNSIGSDNNRKIVIYLTDKKPKEIFEEEEDVTLLSEEFDRDADDVTESIGNLEIPVSSDIPADDAEDEVVAVETTHPAEDVYAEGEDEDIK